MVRATFTNVERIRKNNGRAFYYYRVRRGGQTIRLRMPDDPRSPEFVAQWLEYSQPQDEGKKITPHSFDALVTSYKSGAEFQQLSPITKRDYHRRLDWIGEKLGNMDASKYPRAEVIWMRDACQDRPREANYRISVMSVIMERAINLGWRPDNPAKGVKKLKLGKGYRPWTQQEIESYFQHADPIGAMIVELALGTGQRPSDLPKMRWDDYDGEFVRVVTSKAGKEMWLPPTERLKGVLERAKVDAKGLTIIGSESGQPLSYAAIEGRARKIRKKAGIEGASLHGLRKNATIELAEAGCSNAQIKAITNHETDAMVAHYASGARQKVLAREARSKTKKNEIG